MTDRPLQLALRELRVDFTNRKGLMALAGVGVLLGISGPFETYTHLSLLPRVLYWVAMTYVTYAVGAFTNMYLQYRFSDRLGPRPLQMLVYGFATSIGVMAVVSVINAVAFGETYASFSEALTQFAAIAVICIVIVALLMLLTPLPDASDQHPAILARLPLEKRGALVALAVQDHYVRVSTRKGHEMLLMRLSDAIKETAPTKGMQVHRSHWVALDQIARAERTGDRADLTLKDGTVVPASRSYIPALRDAGLLVSPSRG